MTDSVARRALVVGLGNSGLAAARHLRDAGARVTVVDDDVRGDVQRRADALRHLGVLVRLGTGLDDEDSLDASVAGVSAVDDLLAGTDLVVASPGVPPTHPLVREARERGLRLWSEVELASRATLAPVVAVTGTNGKTTVVTLIGNILEAAGIPVSVCGNIGTPMIVSGPDVPPEGVVVVEVSSFQLALTERFRPRVGVLLNIAEDHLDWHRDFNDYARSKARIWANQGPGDLAVYSADDPIAARLGGAAPGRRATFSARPRPVQMAGQPSGQPDDDERRGARWDDGTLVVAGLGGVDHAEIHGPFDSLAPHERANYAAAAAVCTELGVLPDVIGASLRAFEPLPHRLQVVSRGGGVTYVDDSKATNPHAAVTAIAAYDRVVLIAGGRNKGLDLGRLAEVADRLRASVAIGEAAQEVESVLSGAGVPVSRASSMEEAVRHAASTAQPGDTVLLSPACASFDMFDGYGARGEAFAAAVRRSLEQVSLEQEEVQ